MFNREQIRLDKFKFRRVFIIENSRLWAMKNTECNKDTDLVLCTDFSLFHTLKEDGYSVAFLDNLVDNYALQELNFKMHDFLQNWFRDENGNDLLSYKGFDIGDALLLDILNDVTYFCHLFFNIIALKTLDYTHLFLAIEDPLIEEIVNKVGLSYTPINNSKSINNQPVFSFPITKWMNEKISRTSLKHRFKDTITIFFDYFLSMIDLLKPINKNQVFIQNYFPTNAVIQKLLKNTSLQLVFSDYTGLKNIIKQRRVVYKKTNCSSEAIPIIDRFKKARKKKWEYNGHTISDYLYEKLLPIIESKLEMAISDAKSINIFFSKHPIQLMIPITNLWLKNRLIMNYCRNNHIPIFMIINGLLNNSFYEDAHDSDWVNCYSESIKQEYFKNAANALPLGDPRMDYYATTPIKKIDRENPTIVIGAAGYDLLDLNSYLAYEFDFLHDILDSITKLKPIVYNSTIILKVRGNGYTHLYKKFIETYFPKTNIVILQNKPFKEIIIKADLYISSYSQTIFEATLLGVPVIYYKKDTQFMHSPFDEKSELVTAKNVSQLKEKIQAFYSSSSIYNAFQNNETLEKYVGFVDGRNTDRNVAYINELLKQ